MNKKLLPAVACAVAFSLPPATAQQGAPAKSGAADAAAIAKRLVGDVLAGEAAEASARKACFDRVAKVLPGRKAARNRASRGYGVPMKR